MKRYVMKKCAASFGLWLGLFVLTSSGQRPEVSGGGINTNDKAVSAGSEVPKMMVWEIPAGGDALSRDSWIPAKGSGVYKGGAAVENGKVAIVAAVGGESVLLIPGDRGIKATAQIVPVAAGKGFGKITGVRLEHKEESEVTLKVTFVGADISVGLRQGQLFAVVVPGKGVGAIEVGGKTAYVIMPDFFGHDVIFDPKRLKNDSVTPPVENFILNIQKGGDAIIMCVWQGPLSLGKQATGDEKDPRVDLVFAGQGKDRYVAKTRHECDGKPLYVALLASKGQWFEKNISMEQAQKPLELDWARPYEAKWRADFMGKEGAFCNDFMVKDMSWDVTYDSDHVGRRSGESGYPTMWLQGAFLQFMLPAVILDKSTKKTLISIYSDYSSRGAASGANEVLREQAKKENKEFVPVYPTNMFERVIVYAIDRRKETPLTVMTPSDVMRECLGVGPCQYVLDLEGLGVDTNKTTRNGHSVNATCFTYDAWISQFEAAARGENANLGQETRNGIKGVPLAGLKAGEKFKPEDEAILIDRLEDLMWFFEVISKRLIQYHKFAKSTIEFCNVEVGKNPALKSIADPVIAEANILLTHCSDARMEESKKMCAIWRNRISPVVAEVKTGVYNNVRHTGGIRDDAESQDNLMGICHRCVKGMRQSASMTDSSDLEVAKFANRVRAMCHDMLRSKGHFEY